MEKKKILVVDDEADICNILKFNLDNAGFDTTVAHSGEEVAAVEVAVEQVRLLLVPLAHGHAPLWPGQLFQPTAR